MLGGKEKLLAVVDAGERLVGIVDRADILRGLVTSAWIGAFPPCGYFHAPGGPRTCSARSVGGPASGWPSAGGTWGPDLASGGLWR